MDTLQEILRTLGRLESKVDGFTEKHIDHDQRLDALEKFEGEMNKKIAWVAGAFSVIGVGISYAFTHLVSYITEGKWNA